MRIRYKSSIDDKVAFQLYHYSRPEFKRTTTKAISKIKWLFLVTALLLTSNLALLAYIFNSGVLFYVGLGWLVWVIVVLLRYRSDFLNKDRVHKFERKLRSQEEISAEEMEHLVEITDLGICDATHLYEEKIFWKAISRVAVTEDHAFIYTVLGSAIIVPKGSIIEGDLDEFLIELNKRLDTWRNARESQISPT